MLLETNIDDLNPQIYEYLFERLFTAGALDVWLTPIFMKKNRPANLFSVLLSANILQDCVRIIFKESSTIGLRVREVRRITASRELRRVETPFGNAGVKVSAFEGEVVHMSPEYEDCKRLAAEKNIPLKTVQCMVVELAKKQYNDTNKGVL